jgi:type VI protein secretion system component VasF
LLPFALRPFLTPLAKSALREFACHFYAEEKAKEMKSDPNYVLSSAKKLRIILQAMPEVQKSQGFKALRNDLTTELEKFHAMITQEYVLKANDLNADAKRGRYHTAICK